MALSIAELELQSVDYLPAREVMGKCGRPKKKKYCGCDDGSDVKQDASADDNTNSGLLQVNVGGTNTINPAPAA